VRWIYLLPPPEGEDPVPALALERRVHTYVPPPCSAPHSAASVPEPGALALWILGLVALGVHRAYRRAIRTEYAAPPSAPCTVRTSQ